MKSIEHVFIEVNCLQSYFYKRSRTMLIDILTLSITEYGNGIEGFVFVRKKNQTFTCYQKSRRFGTVYS